MAKKDNVSLTLMMHCYVNLQCDNEKLELRYKVNPNDTKYNVWFCNGENTGLQVTGLIKMLKEKYSKIKVLYKKQF